MKSDKNHLRITPGWTSHLCFAGEHNPPGVMLVFYPKTKADFNAHGRYGTPGAAGVEKPRVHVTGSASSAP
ncbi:hypothetical protein CORMATOL_02571 [Corynebacterium matruchotii ATCC 33806]|uniref:Uncharacterized protein n=1 Tax=Corynebacterium matruchotii ATCC 33806 TaxID=566549 RepID=C0E6D8_9CORY|nr:hypothetical protein CORMATOL_02571 [Corynebacterium matruchotii ATCC 33806]